MVVAAHDGTVGAAHTFLGGGIVELPIRAEGLASVGLLVVGHADGAPAALVGGSVVVGSDWADALAALGRQVVVSSFGADNRTIRMQVVNLSSRRTLVAGLGGGIVDRVTRAHNLTFLACQVVGCSSRAALASVFYRIVHCAFRAGTG